MNKKALFEKLFHRKTDADKDLENFLSKVNLFSSLSKKELKNIIKIIHIRAYAPDETIFRQGEKGVGMYIIRSGNVSIYEEFPSRKMLKLADLGEGDFFGELALFAESPRSATAVAKSDCRILGFFQPDLFELLDSNPALGVKVILTLAQILATRMLRSMEVVKEE